MKLTEAQFAHLVVAHQDGTLSNEEKATLEAYLLHNPELAFDLEGYAPLSLPTSHIDLRPMLRSEFENIAIYQSENGHPYEKLAIGSFEGLLSNEDAKIEALLDSDASYLQVKAQIHQTQLHPDDELGFPDNNLLLKNAPVRSINWKSYATIVSSAAAVILVSLLIAKFGSTDSRLMSKPIKQAQLVKTKKSSAQNEIVQINQIKKEDPQTILSTDQEWQLLSYAYPQLLELGPDTQKVLVTQSNLVLTEEITPEITSNINLAQSNSSAFHKEPITMKAFLIQKTNERLFGTAKPSSENKLETLARYAKESVGIPVAYKVEEAQNQDKLVFQLGPITIEKSRTRK